MKVLWLFPPSKIEGQIPLVGQNRWFKYMPNRANFIYPVVVAYGCTMMKEAGHDVSFLDYPAENINGLSLRDMETFSKYDIVIMEGRTAVINWIWEIAKDIKSHCKDTKIAMFGDHVMCKPQESIDKGIDYVINCGDYDYGALMLVNALSKDQDSVPQIFTVPNMASMDNLPFLDRDIVPWRNYYESWRHKDTFGWVAPERGCHARCVYCSWVPTFYHGTVRVMSPRMAVNEIHHAYDKYGIREFLDDSDTFYKTFGIKFLEELETRKLDVLWNIQTRADQIPDVETLKRMWKSGLRLVKLGADAGNEGSLLMIRKGHTVKDVELSVKRLKKAKLEVHINMVIGYPWETKKEAYDTIKWLVGLKPNQAQFSLLQPYVGTPLYEDAMKNGWFNIDPLDYDSWDTKKVILKGIMTPEEITKLYRDAWREFYFNRRFILHQLGHAVSESLIHRSLTPYRKLWRGYNGVKGGHLKAMD